MYLYNRRKIKSCFNFTVRMQTNRFVLVIFLPHFFLNATKFMYNIHYCALIIHDHVIQNNKAPAEARNI